MEEIWKVIDNYPNYEVSNAGLVRNKNSGKILQQTIGREGRYLNVYLSNNGVENTQRVHRLVAKAFIPNPEDKPQVNHINGNRFDNTIANLEWCTSKENNMHAVQTGLNHPGEYQKKPIQIVETGEIFDGVVACSEAIGADFRNVYRSVCTDGHYAVNGLHCKYANSNERPKRKPFLFPHQKEAIDKMFNGCVLNGTVGSGKSRAGLYYYFSQYGGSIEDEYVPMKNPPDLYILTTAKKRNDLEWDGELSHFLMSRNPEINYYKNKIVVDSWQNIKKYDSVAGAFFIFDENKINGKGAWAKSFLKITKNNEWIILSASNGDRWEDFETLFIAEGFFRTRGEFRNQHLIYSPYISKYPKVTGYRNEGRLFRLRDKVLIDMDFQRHTVQHHEDVYTQYDIGKYKDAMRHRWDPYKDVPIEQASGLCYVLRRIVNEDESRQTALLEILEDHPKAIIFYNFDPELEILLNLGYCPGTEIAQYNGHKHEPIPTGDKWVYLVNYNACEAWNTTSTNCMIFYSQTYSYKTLIQASGRIDRLTTPYNDLYYFHLKSRSGIDLAISKALREKKQFNETKFVKW